MKTRQLTKDCKPIVETCKGCNKVFNFSDGLEYCLAYSNPAAFWKNSERAAAGEEVVLGKGCGLASHIKTEVMSARKKRVGQQKQKKG